MSIKILLYKLRELRYDVEISHRNIVEIYKCICGYYARLICSVPPVVQWSHPGVCTISSWGCLTGCHPAFLLGGCCCEAVYGDRSR